MNVAKKSTSKQPLKWQPGQQMERKDEEADSGAASADSGDSFQDALYNLKALSGSGDAADSDRSEVKELQTMGESVRNGDKHDASLVKGNEENKDILDQIDDIVNLKEATIVKSTDNNTNHQVVTSTSSDKTAGSSQSQTQAPVTAPKSQPETASDVKTDQGSEEDDEVDVIKENESESIELKKEASLPPNGVLDSKNKNPSGMTSKTSSRIGDKVRNTVHNIMSKLVQSNPDVNNLLSKTKSEDRADRGGSGAASPSPLVRHDKGNLFDNLDQASSTLTSVISSKTSPLSSSEKEGGTRGRGTRGRGQGATQRRGRGAVLDQPLVPPNNTQPDIPEFTGEPGLKIQPDGDRPLDYYKLFLNNEIVDKLVLETNRYADQVISVSRPQKRFARLADWKATDRAEMFKFFGLLLLTGIVSKPTIETYWSTLPILYTPVFSQLMSRNRFQALLRFWHCNDNSQEPSRNAPDRDRLYKIRPLVTHLQEKFRLVYIPDKFVAIDESLLLWKGKLLFKQYIPLKRARFGIKLFNVCEDSGYTFEFHIYTGKEDPAFQIQQYLPPDAAHLSTTEKIVVFMTRNLLSKGYRLFMDNWYTGSALYQYMKNKNTVCCGTMRENRAPVEMRQLQVSQQEPVKSLRSGSLLFMKWQSSKVVYMLTTMHDESMQEVVRKSGQKVNKPSCVVSYNAKMGAVDRADQMLQPYDASRKTTRWYKKVMTHLLQVSLLNAYLVFKKHTDSRLDFLTFQLQVISDLLYGDNPPPQAALPRSEDVARLTERHFPTTLEKAIGKRSSGRRCKVCSKRGVRKETSFVCAQCPSNPSLCIQPCFEVYHTKKNY